jgi:hypothetical protein
LCGQLTQLAWLMQGEAARLHASGSLSYDPDKETQLTFLCLIFVYLRLYAVSI